MSSNWKYAFVGLMAGIAGNIMLAHRNPFTILIFALSFLLAMQFVMNELTNYYSSPRGETEITADSGSASTGSIPVEGIWKN